jgi:hypothetical protein
VIHGCFPAVQLMLHSQSRCPRIFLGSINGLFRLFIDSMKTAIEFLFSLQCIEMGPDSGAPQNVAEILRLRQKIPAPVLAHYDRLRARDKKGVSVVRNSVCSECHMRLASGIYASLLRAEDILICDTCGRYLHIPPGTEVAPTVEPEVPKTPVKRRRKKTQPTEPNP